MVFYKKQVRTKICHIDIFKFQNRINYSASRIVYTCELFDYIFLQKHISNKYLTCSVYNAKTYFLKHSVYLNAKSDCGRIWRVRPQPCIFITRQHRFELSIQINLHKCTEQVTYTSERQKVSDVQFANLKSPSIPGHRSSPTSSQRRIVNPSNRLF